MFDDLVWEVDAEGIPGKTEAEADGTILAAESDVGVEVEHCALHAQVSLVGHGFDVVLAMLHEATVGQGTTVPQKQSREPDDSTMTVLASVMGTTWAKLHTLLSSCKGWSRRRS